MSGYHHSPAFNRLCDLADVRGMQVRLPAGELMHGRRDGEEHRHLTHVVLWRDGKPVDATPIFDDDLEAAALVLLAAA
jgi:hypothetical protein